MQKVSIKIKEKNIEIWTGERNDIGGKLFSCALIKCFIKEIRKY